MPQVSVSAVLERIFTPLTAPTTNAAVPLQLSPVRLRLAPVMLRPWIVTLSELTEKNAPENVCVRRGALTPRIVTDLLTPIVEPTEYDPPLRHSVPPAAVFASSDAMLPPPMTRLPLGQPLGTGVGVGDAGGTGVGVADGLGAGVDVPSLVVTISRGAYPDSRDPTEISSSARSMA